MTATTPMSHTQCAAALDAPGVAENAAQVIELVDRRPDVVDDEPLGGARVLRRTTGATAFSILAFGSRSPGDGEMVADRQRA